MTGSIGSTDQVRRAAAFVKAILEDDSLAHQVLGPETPDLLEHLWLVDPLRAALFVPVAQADRDLVTSLCALVVAIAKRPVMDDDDLAAFLGRVLEVGSGQDS